MLRSQKAITQAELAERLGVSNRSISRWENGTTMPDFDLVYASIVNIIWGYVGGTLLTGLMYASRYIAKLRESRTRLKRSLQRLK